MASPSQDRERFSLSSASVPLGGLTLLCGIGITAEFIFSRVGVIERLDSLWFFLGIVSIACGYQAVVALPHLTEQLRILHHNHATMLADLDRKVRNDQQL